jgi:autotransporter adhesin
MKIARASFASQLLARTVLSAPIVLAVVTAQQAQAQQRLVSACSGVSLPPSVVTDILSPVINGTSTSTEAAVNDILDTPILGLVVPPLNLNATGLLAQAAAGAPITLQALATDGTVVGPGDQCRATSDSITLNTPAGVAIGGNQITGLGADGAAAFASDMNAIAMGNNARAEAGATGGIAFGQNSQVTAANSVALGAGSVASRGALAGYVASGLPGTQSSAGEVSVGAPGALRQITNVAAGSAPTDAATVGQVDGVAAQVAALGATSVQYNSTARDRLTLAGAAGTTIDNLAPGALTANSTEAVNGGQLFATNAQLAANTAAIAGLGSGLAGVVRYSDAATPTTPNNGTVTDDGTLAGASGGPVGLHNVRDGALAAGSTDAVNGGQLFTTNQAVANLQTAVGSQPLRYADAATPTTPNGGAISDDTTLVGASGGAVGLHNVRAGALVAGSTDAVNGDQLAATNTQVAANTAAITNFNNLVVGSAVSPVQYSNAATPTVPNGGTLTNDVTFVGADAAAPVTLHNVAGGAVTAGSTDAVNGQQLFAVATQSANSVQYDRTAAGGRSNTITLAGGEAGAVTLGNVANGTVAAGSTQAVNGGQLATVAQVAQQAAALGANSVQYGAGNTTVTFNSTGSAVLLRNVAAGTAATDAVNVGQLQSGLTGAVAQANSYTDARLSAALESMNFNLREVRRDLGAGTSSALAAAALPQATEPGRSMVAMGGGTYRGQTAFALGASTYLNDGHSIFRIGATVDSQGKGGANAGYGYQF